MNTDLEGYFFSECTFCSRRARGFAQENRDAQKSREKARSSDLIDFQTGPGEHLYPADRSNIFFSFRWGV